MRIASAGHAVFAATMIALGILGLTKGHFGVVWQPVPNGVPGREVLAYLSASISVVSGLGLLWKRKAALAARVLLAYRLFWLLVFRVLGLFRALSVDVYWSVCSTAVMVAAAWVVCDWCATGWDKRRPALTAGDTGPRTARVRYCLAVIL